MARLDTHGGDDQRAEDHANAQDQATENAAIEQARSLPDADTLLRQLAATADPTVQRRATATPPADPDTSGGDALYSHIDIQA